MTSSNDALAGSLALEARRNRLYKTYSSAYTGRKDGSQEALVFRHEILPRLPGGDPGTVSVIDLGCGQGNLVKQLTRHGFTAARGIDISPEQVQIAHAEGISSVECGDYRELLKKERATLSAIIATDFLEHFTKDEVLTIFQEVLAALRPGGVFIARSPNATSPFFGHYQYGDFTHETVFTHGSFLQVASSAGFSHAQAFACPPIGSGLKGFARRAVWSVASSALKLVMSAETGGRGHLVTMNYVGVAVA